jgi:putative SOS response-associated peptidase YedK
MCGRFTQTYTDYEYLSEEIGVSVEELHRAEVKQRWNIAPTDQHWIVRMRYEERHAEPAKWGLINSWAKDASRAAKQINARAETLHTSSAFRDAFANRRCVIPADGYYEWISSGKNRWPVWFHRSEGGLLFFAGLYESWQVQPEQWQRTFTIITTEPNALSAPIHNRMPAVLSEDAIDQWIDPREQDLEGLMKLLVPAAEDVLTIRYVSQRANSVKNDDPACLEPAAEAPKLL